MPWAGVHDGSAREWLVTGPLVHQFYFGRNGADQSWLSECFCGEI